MSSNTQLIIVEWLKRVHDADWNPDAPVEILYLVNQLYPGWVRPSIDSVKLRSQHRDVQDPGCWELVVRDVEAGARRARMIDLIGQPSVENLLCGNTIDFTDLLCSLENLWDVTNLPVVDGHLDILTERAKSLLDDFAHSIRHAHDDGFEQAKQQKDYLADASIFLASALTKNIDLLSSTVASLKNKEPFHVRDGEEKSFWDEIVREVSEPSLLHECFKDDVRAAVLKCFGRLSAADQFAFWLSHQDKEQFMFIVEDGPSPRFDENALNLIEFESLLDAVVYDVMAEARRQG